MIRWKLFVTQIEILSNAIVDTHVQCASTRSVRIDVRATYTTKPYETFHLSLSWSLIFVMAVETREAFALYKRCKHTRRRTLSNAMFCNVPYLT